MVTHCTSGTSIRAPLAIRNGLPRIIRASSSSPSISSTTKPTKKMNLSTFTNTSSIIPLECFNDLSTNYNEAVVGFGSLITQAPWKKYLALNHINDYNDMNFQYYRDSKSRWIPSFNGKLFL